jgi:uncharacterized membrane protein
MRKAATEKRDAMSLREMLLVKPAAGPQVLFTGVLLSLLMLLWMRSAVLIYALFFGVRPFPGLPHITAFLLTEPVGWIILGVGTAVGGLLPHSLLRSVFLPFRCSSIARSMRSRRWEQARRSSEQPAPMIVWGAIVLALFILCAATGLIGLIVIFPWLGHATWHAYRAVSDTQA